jgi:hypothetical protein
MSLDSSKRRERREFEEQHKNQAGSRVKTGLLVVSSRMCYPASWGYLGVVLVSRIALFDRIDPK